VNKATLLIALGLAVAAPGVRADEGRTMLIGPATITQPGQYVLAADIDATGSPVILIQSDRVTLDLNGHTIRNASHEGHTVQIQENARSIRIRNGRIFGGLVGIFHGVSNPASETSLSLENLEIAEVYSAAVTVQNARSIEVLSCRFRNTGLMGLFFGGGIDLSSPTGGVPGATGRVENNDMRDLNGPGLSVTGQFNSLLVRGNTIVRALDWSITINGGGVRLEGNTISGPTAWGIQVNGTGVDLIDNVLSEKCLLASIFSNGPPTGIGNRIVGNVFQAQPGCAGVDLLQVASSRNVIENNLIRGSGTCGIVFFSSASFNSYRGNMLRGNAGGAVCDSGTGNTDNGGNIF